MHGIAGVGKSSLLRAFASDASSSGASVIQVDCRTVEPTPDGMLSRLSDALGTPVSTIDDASKALNRLPGRTVVTLDNYEVFRLADAWLRRELVPALDAGTRVIICSREHAAAGWLSAAEWREHFRTLKIGLLSTEDSLQLLRDAGIEGDAASRLFETTRGHPLALTIAANSRSHQDPAANREDPYELMSALVHRYLEEVEGDDTRLALEAASVVRRVSRPLLEALCPGLDANRVYEDLSKLSFVEVRRDGLAIHDVVRDAIGRQLKAADPLRYRRYQQSAWRYLRQELRETPRADLWRTTADTIYLVNNPVVREAFFPSESSEYSVEPATPNDAQTIFEITARHESDAAGNIMRLWWQHLPGAFHIVRDASGDIRGFSCVARPGELDSNWMQEDPVARQWQYHLRDTRSTGGALFIRRWLSADDGEPPGAVQAATWIDVKRTYLELRPDLRRVYLTVNDLTPYAAVATELGFNVLGDLTTAIGGKDYHSAMLDFGPGSVDGWIMGLLAAELDVRDVQLVDPETRELVVGDKRLPLTPLEFGVVSMLDSRAGKAVSRDELLESVWGHSHEGGSNVVDAVIRGLRKKMEASGAAIETVRGHGFRLNS